ncbi:exodeoxyribonuclease III/DNA ligase D,TIGR02776 [Mucilaginibacter pineti]|uniref:Exodeoxyribonuclease III/DNA ligase D,TIGR02776 n=1 Tax=Mucilaginibacter pineti TaxID=1391627 RepID=A0A1G7JWL9_9SPHI|nr:non-homologous end-joining DNA ligase [Mucilaginibacter pineti]SDF29326.1 exodeoxyribonuclease III/DNA ligase D,TIGR02776 [Mucilaginibacter pineti]
MKIATYNINGINGRLDNLLRWLKEREPDIVCLQELKCENHKFPERQLKGAGYNAIWQGQKSWNGVAILAKSELKELRRDLPGDDEEFTHSRYLEAFVDGIVIGCIYLPNGNPWPGPKLDYKLRWFKRLNDHAKDLVNRELPVILIGDYNVMPTDLDTYKPEKYINNALFRPETKTAYQSLVDQGWTDAIRQLYPNERVYTFWDYLHKAYERDAGLRLDHFLLNPAVADRLSAGGVDKAVRGWQGSSDHAPVWIELSDSNQKLKKAMKKEKTSPSFLDQAKDSQTVKVDGCPLTFNHLSKVYWPEDGITKRDMFNYYDQVAEYMVPYLKDRPMSLNRFPNGIHGPSFYQKDVKDKAPDCMKTMPHTTSDGVEKEYLVATNKASLLWMASLGCIEINPWFSRVTSPDNPDFCVIDLDPDKQHFDQVISAALEVKKVLDAIGVPAYPKTSGSTGMHIYIPLGAKYTYDQSQMFAKIIVTLVHKQIPEYTSLERMVKNRGGKMYLDFLQNRPDATIAGVYSLRPKPGATVSMPLTWDEVRPGLTMRDFTIHNSIARLKETGDLFKNVLGERIDLATTIKKAQSTF